MSEEQRLYGIPGAESMDFDPASVYESHIDGWDGADGEPPVIEEWSVREPRDVLPSPECLLEWISEWTGDYGEVSADFDIIPETKEVKAAAEAFLDHIASKITWRQADKHLASHVVTWDEKDEPLLDGEPMYRRISMEQRQDSGLGRLGMKRRLRACVEAWPECEEGKYDPHCCRFPKSCSCTIYDEKAVTEADLEPNGSA